MKSARNHHYHHHHHPPPQMIEIQNDRTFPDSPSVKSVRVSARAAGARAARASVSPTNNSLPDASHKDRPPPSALPPNLPFRRGFLFYLTAAGVLAIFTAGAVALALPLANRLQENNNNSDKSVASVVSSPQGISSSGSGSGSEDPANDIFEHANNQSPTVALTNRPSETPSTTPSLRPSFSPSVLPTVSPSQSPTSQPTSRPTSRPTFSPTRPRLPDGLNFRLKMHWEQSFFWQEQDAERQWCLECTTCRDLTASDIGDGCYDYDNNDGTDCRNGDQLWLQNCNGWAGSRGNTDFEIVARNNNNNNGGAYGGGDQLKIRNRDLCLTRASNVHLDLQPCESPTSNTNSNTNANYIRQLFVGFQLDRPFDLRPLQQNWRPNQYETPVQVHRCLSQHHHPKKYEMLFLVECDLAHLWDTALWDALV